MTSKTILVINQYYRPDVASSGQLLSELCEFLYSEGINVHVVTGQPSYTTGAPAGLSEQLLNGVQIHRVHMGNATGKASLRIRCLGYLRFMFRAWYLSKKISRIHHPDAVITLSNPPTVGLIGRMISKKHKIPYIYVLYDIHPDILTTTNWIRLPSIVIKLWHFTNSIIFKSATKIIVPSHTMKNTLVHSKSLDEQKISVIPNWARPEIKVSDVSYAIRSKFNIPQDHTILLYAGNIGIMQQLDPIIDAAYNLLGKPIHFLFLGEGESKSALIEKANTAQLSNVTFLSYQPEKDFAQIVSESNACIVSLQEGLDAYSAPSRAYTFLSAGTPLITIMPEKSELAVLVRDNSCGWNATDSDQLTNLLQTLLNTPEEYSIRGQNAEILYRTKFEQKIVMNQYLNEITIEL